MQDTPLPLNLFQSKNGRIGKPGTLNHIWWICTLINPAVYEKYLVCIFFSPYWYQENARVWAFLVSTTSPFPLINCTYCLQVSISWVIIWWHSIQAFYLSQSHVIFNVKEQQSGSSLSLSARHSQIFSAFPAGRLQALKQSAYHGWRRTRMVCRVKTKVWYFVRNIRSRAESRYTVRSKLRLWLGPGHCVPKGCGEASSALIRTLKPKSNHSHTRYTV